MASLNDLTTAIVNRLTAAQQSGGSLAAAASAVILREDAHNLETEINKAIGKTGMLILVGMPRFKNSATLSNPNVQMEISAAVAIGENPAIWRKPDSSRPTAPQVTQTVCQLLHAFRIAGFQPLAASRGDYVPDKKRQLYEIPIETLLVVPTLAN
jgi:hypothetical protein